MKRNQLRVMSIALTLIGVMLAALFAWTWTPALAAPLGQTVPIPTATPPIEVPEATPTPDDGDDGDDGDSGDDENVDPGEEEGSPEDGELAPAPGGQPLLPEGEVVVLTQVGDAEASLYAGPGTGFDLLGTLPAGTPVELIGRNAGLAWYVVCCLPNGQAGWVAAVQLVDAPLAEVTALPVLSDWRVEVEEGTTDVAPVPAAGEVELDLLVSHSPQIVLPGEDVTLQFEITNLSNEAASDVQLRAEIVDALTFLTGQSVGGELTAPSAGDAPAIVLAEWPQLEPGEMQLVTLTMSVGENQLPGSVIAQLAAVNAANAPATTAQALVGLPPEAVPSFR